MTEIKNNFLSAVTEWICDDYAIDIRCIAMPNQNGSSIISATIGIYPREAEIDNSFSIRTENILATQIQIYPISKAEINRILINAIDGKITIAQETIKLQGDLPFDYYSESTQRDRWFSELHLQIGGEASAIPPSGSLSKIDNDLRLGAPPFDGLSDLTGWLGLESAALNGGRPTITVRVGPPADLIFERSNLSGDQLNLELHAHSSFDIERLTLAIRAVPGNGMLGRQQLTSAIKWGGSREQKKNWHY